MLHSGMQNQMIQCEIKQDNDLFNADPAISDVMTYSRIFFRMEDTKIEDVIAVSSTYKNTSGNKVNYAERGNAVTGEWFNQLESAILSMVDPSFEGLCAVYIDCEDYAVDSAICFEPALSRAVDLKNVATIDTFFASITSYIPTTYDSGESIDKSYRMLISSSKQRECIDKKGIYFGAYPTINATN